MKILRAALGNAVVLTVLFFALWPVVMPYVLWVFEAVLVALN